eukprot:2875242-Prymnesium_polylepis.1
MGGSPRAERRGPGRVAGGTTSHALSPPVGSIAAGSAPAALAGRKSAAPTLSSSRVRKALPEPSAGMPPAARTKGGARPTHRPSHGTHRPPTA